MPPVEIIIMKDAENIVRMPWSLRSFARITGQGHMLVWRCRPFTRRARVEESGLFIRDILYRLYNLCFRYAQLCTVTRNLFIQAFSALDVTKVERAKAGKTNCYR